MSEDKYFTNTDLTFRMNFLRTSIAEATWRNVSGTQILNTLRQHHDFSMGNSLFFSIRREVLERFSSYDTFRLLPKDQVTPDDIINYDHNLDLTTKYLHIFEVYGIHRNSGETIRLSTARASNTLQTIQDMENNIRADFQVGRDDSDVIVSEVNLVNVWGDPERRGI